ncbi:iron-containing redox enzyme family protein [Streptomyces sp. YC504]|uniref:Iron-containing redox enzyme family protein n=1 Tax=Streptomyces mesophilus TaxID=1775132 RepID=A0A6G4XKV1_9ACTN|nr:iron-containing redox enzyme family protein [Streptomyces mesophilus]NGO77802.1 iron-containing redox enzyme family protein [Streptomyces mesophilus]
MSAPTVAAAPSRATRTPSTAAEAARTVYGKVVDPEAALPAGRLLTEIRTELEGSLDPDGGLDALRRRAADWSAAETLQYQELREGLAPDTREVLVRRTALACAPLSLMSGAWLQWLSSPGNGDDPAVLAVLALYAADLGVGAPRASRGDAYLPVLRQLDISENAVPARRLTADQRIDDGHFRLAALLLAMSRRPDDFLPEILGADLCLRSVGLLPALTLVRAERPTITRWDVVDPATARGEGRTGTDLAQSAVEAVIARDGEEARTRISTGFRWALAALREWSGRLHTELTEACDPVFEMAELMRLRAREGSVYHHDYALEGRQLSDWLKECQTDPRPMLAALSRSRLVRPGAPGQSMLVTGLVGEKGRMFRVFSPEDLGVVRRWIGSLSGPAEGTPEAGAPLAPARPLALSAWRPEDGGTPPADVREAYHLLLNRTDTPAVRAYAREYVHGWLGRSRHGIDDSSMALPEQWTPQGLRPWLVDMHDQHSEAFEQGAEQELPSRDELIDSTVQLAPLTLIDGAWIKGFTDYEHASSEIGHSLFDTYWDELGNGQADLNHPLIYREVLIEMGFDLPPTASRAFAAYDGFRDGSFELPVYWLSIGRFPQTFMPEVLGLNLAMELSGVGGTYRRARLALKKYGFSTRFVDIHNTVDNVATGHSAWAADAIDTYLSSITASQGAGALDAAWQRVRTGYRSLNPPSGFRARQAGRRAARDAVKGR